MAHRLLKCNSPKCAVPHGHNEYATFHISVYQPERAPAPCLPIYGDLANSHATFDNLKGKLFHWIDGYVDHALQLGHDDPLIGYFQDYEPSKLPRLLVTWGDPTTEALAYCLWAKANALLAGTPHFQCTKVELEETPTNKVVLTREIGTDSFEKQRPFRAGSPWWYRGDMSINNLMPEDYTW
jgi:6-pyruvoyltetrahydropterin/6-carboxytetrahydropterin synthase